jgi:hypothetical protein
VVILPKMRAAFTNPAESQRGTAFAALPRGEMGSAGTFHAKVIDSTRKIE